MPYIVTTKRRKVAPNYSAPPVVVFSRVAVGTLGEAKRYIGGLFVDKDGDEVTEDLIDRLTESGGTVGPLPDGSLIEVERVGAIDLFNRAGLPKGPPYKTVAQVIAAFNEANR